MTIFELYKKKADCCGCELCVQSCPQNVLVMEQDEEGFYYPQIHNPIQCIDCRRCISVCPIKNEVEASKTFIKSYGGFALDKEEIRTSASGGFASVLSKQFINSGGIVYGVEYDSSDYLSVNFTRCDNVQSIESLKSSKYVQARKNNVYREVSRDLKEGKRVLFFGLPCEVAALKKFVPRSCENLFTVSLICHGPTSLRVHREYCQGLIEKNNAKIKFFSVRHKENAWKPYFVKTQFENDEIKLEEFHKSNYGIAFRYLKRPSCSTCSLKIGANGLPGDLVIGDFHYATQGMNAYHYLGSSQIGVCTDKGEKLLKEIENVFALHEISNKISYKYNLALRMPIPQRINREQFSRIFVTKGLEAACNLMSVRFLDSYVRYKGLIIGKLAKSISTLKRNIRL